MGVAPVWKISLLIKVSSDLGLPCRGPQRHLRHQSAPRVRSKDTAPFWPKPRSPRLVPLARACPGQGLGRGRAQGPRAWRPILPLPLPLPQANLWAGTHGQETFPHRPWGPQGAGGCALGWSGSGLPPGHRKDPAPVPSPGKGGAPGLVAKVAGKLQCGPWEGPPRVAPCCLPVLFPRLVPGFPAATRGLWREGGEPGLQEAGRAGKGGAGAQSAPAPGRLAALLAHPNRLTIPLSFV